MTDTLALENVPVCLLNCDIDKDISADSSTLREIYTESYSGWISQGSMKLHTSDSYSTMSARYLAIRTFLQLTNDGKPGFLSAH
jgi:hypothetical protein